jgi:hypothetical protein
MSIGRFDVAGAKVALTFKRATQACAPNLSHNIKKRTTLLDTRAARIVALTATIGLALSGMSALGKDVKVALTGAEETPPVTTSATGSGTIKIAKDKTVSGSIKTAGIEGIAAHIHVGAFGVAGPPIITLEKSADGSTWSVPAGSKLTDEQYASFEAGKLYVNIHSAEHKPGEIRAQLKP